MSEQRCEASGKIRYRSERTAAAIPSVIGIYLCEDCGDWHRSSREIPANIARAEKARERPLDGPRVPHGSHGTTLGDVWPQP